MALWGTCSRPLIISQACKSHWQPQRLIRPQSPQHIRSLHQQTRRVYIPQPNSRTHHLLILQEQNPYTLALDRLTISIPARLIDTTSASSNHRDDNVNDKNNKTFRDKIFSAKASDIRNNTAPDNGMAPIFGYLFASLLAPTSQLEAHQTAHYQYALHMILGYACDVARNGPPGNNSGDGGDGESESDSAVAESATDWSPPPLVSRIVSRLGGLGGGKLLPSKWEFEAVEAGTKDWDEYWLETNDVLRERYGMGPAARFLEVRLANGVVMNGSLHGNVWFRVYTRVGAVAQKHPWVGKLVVIPAGISILLIIGARLLMG
ncbi:hypothetical protein QBC44DRAFT_367389 [Cladorrhinum sp. PSN332]|nr:hypothetical protein QBC44DRAFT_367389 [Cladorrhinum sp. PSN332]